MRQRHHFVPQFYLREWYRAGADGFLVYFRDERGALQLRKRTARSIAFIHNLYSVLPDGLNFRKFPSNHIETDFFAPLDNAASVIHRKLVDTGINEISTEDRWVWSLFINSLMERSPQRIDELKNLAAKFPQEAVEKLKSRNPTGTISQRLQTIVENIDIEAAARNAVLEALTQYIVDENFLRYVIEMQWLTIDLPEGQNHYLTGDTPVIINGGGSTAPIYILSLALSPRRLLVMHKDTPEFDAQFILQMALHHSIAVVKQTKRHLVSSRVLADSDHIKYERIVSKVLCAALCN